MTQHGYICCASCHLDGFEDGRVWDFTDRGEGLRNTTSLLGKRGVGQGRLHWSANFDEVQDFEHDIRNAFNGTGFMCRRRLHDRHAEHPLGDPKAGVSRELDDLAAYVTSLDRVRPSPFRAPDGALTARRPGGPRIFAQGRLRRTATGAPLHRQQRGRLARRRDAAADVGQTSERRRSKASTPRRCAGSGRRRRTFTTARRRPCSTSSASGIRTTATGGPARY